MPVGCAAKQAKLVFGSVAPWLCQDAFFDLLENARAGALIPDRSMISALRRRIEVAFGVVVLGE